MKFRFEAFDRAGNLVEGDVEAATAREAQNLVRSRGVTPYAIRPPRVVDLLLHDFRRDVRARPVADASLARLSRDLAVLLQAGVPLDAALRTASTTAEDRPTRDLAVKLLEGVLEGANLADVMAGMGRTFRPEYVRIIQAGDISADLGRAMQELADLLDRRVEIRSRIRAAMTYPALLVFLAVVSLGIVLGLLVPAVTPIFLENGMPLPSVLAGLDAVRENGILILGLAASCLAAAAGAFGFARRNAGLKLACDKLVLSVPVVGPVSELREAARFTRTLGTLIRAGVPPLQALQSSCPLVRNQYVRSLLDRAIADVRAGVSIGGALANASALPMVVRQLVAVGEESGRLQDMLMRAAMILERQEQARTARLLAVLTPAVTMLVAGLIGVVILSVMGAILSLNDLAVL
jgi:general secretion pathway protein F